MAWIRGAVVAGLLLGGGAGVEATGEVTSPPAPGTGLVSTTESSSVRLQFDLDGGPVTGEVRVVYRVEFTEVSCRQRATFLFALKGEFDAAANTMQGDAVEGGSTVVVAGCEGLTTDRPRATTPWTATVDRVSGVITGRLVGGAPVDFVATADPTVLRADEPEDSVPSTTTPTGNASTSAARSGETQPDSGGEASPLPFLLGGALLLFGGFGAWRFWPRSPLTLAEMHRLLGQAAVAVETADPTNAKAWKQQVVRPIAEVARRMPVLAAMHRDDVTRIFNEVKPRPRRFRPSISEISERGDEDGWWRHPRPNSSELQRDLEAVQQRVELVPGFDEVIM